ncbi:MAG: hypothetical protein Q7S02_04820 [bacterium]|nr:hypothetical protein [bacterium]
MDTRNNVPLDVLATFTAAGVRPIALRMGGRRYEPLQVHLTHTVREGRKLWRVFSVTDGPPAAPEDGNHFTLAFDPEDCRWRLWENA